jgi:hypothetical protein
LSRNPVVAAAVAGGREAVAAITPTETASTRTNFTDIQTLRSVQGK